MQPIKEIGTVDVKNTEYTTNYLPNNRIAMHS